MNFHVPHFLFIATLLLMVFGGALFALPESASAVACPANTLCAPDSLPKVETGQTSIKAILSIVFGIIGSLALLMIVVSGVKYITSSGDPQKASEAKNGVLYALIGLIIAILAQAIVAFVVNRT